MDKDKKGRMQLKIKELDLSMIFPNSSNIDKEGQGGHKIVVIGKPGTGKSTLLSRILYEKRKLIPTALVVSGTEDSNHHYSQILPSSLIHNSYNEELIQSFITRQKLARKHLKNPFSVLLLDDATDDPKVLARPIFQTLFKNGRHFSMLFILSLQYCLDIKPVIRSNVDGVFILRESLLRNRKSLYDNYAGGIIPSFSMFCELLDQITGDYTALYIHNASSSNELEDLVFWYKAPPTPKFKFGSIDCWKHHHTRFNEKYEEF